MRIVSVTCSNFRSLGDPTNLPLRALNVLVGQNGAGKSNVIDALVFLRDAVLHGLGPAILERGGIRAVRRHSEGKPFDVTLQIRFDGSDASGMYEFVLTGDRLDEFRVKREKAEITRRIPELRTFSFLRNPEWSSTLQVEPRTDSMSLALTSLAGDERFEPLIRVLRGIAAYSIFPDALREPQKYDPEPVLKRHGQNWVSVLRSIEKDPVAKKRLVEGLSGLVHDLADFRTQSAAGFLVAEFRKKLPGGKQSRWLPASLESDGTLRMAGLLTALLQADQLSLIALEEPELTIHPGALPLVYDHVAEAAQRTQVLITSHSPEFLNCIRPIGIDESAQAEDERLTASVFLVQKRHGPTAVEPQTRHDMESVQDHLQTLGEWVLTRQLSLFDGNAAQ